MGDEPLSQYELDRLANVERNKAVLKSLGLAPKDEGVKKVEKPKPKPQVDVPLVPVRVGERERKLRKFQSYAGLDGGKSGARVSVYAAPPRARRDESSDEDDDDFSDVDSDADEVDAYRKRKRPRPSASRPSASSGVRASGRERGRTVPRMRDLAATKGPRPRPRPPRPAQVSQLSSASAAPSLFPSLAPPAPVLAPAEATHFLGVSPFAAAPLPMPDAEDDDGKVRCPFCRGRFVLKGGRFMRKHQDPEYGGECRASGQTLEMLGIA